MSAFPFDGLPSMPNMVLVGSFGRNSGKTTLACRLIRAFQDRWPVIAMKVVSVSKEGRHCHRGSAGCGLCTGLSEPYCLIEEKDAASPKDTAQMLRAGAQKSFLLLGQENALFEGLSALLDQVPPGTLLVCESNTLRKIVAPGVFLFADAGTEILKPSARTVLPLADGLVTPNGRPVENMVAVDEQADGNLLARYVC